MKNIKTLVVAAAVFVSLLAPTVAQAKDIKTIGFNLPMYQGIAFTPGSLKGATGGSSVMNISDIAYGSYAVDGYLVNYDDFQRGNYATGLMQNTRSTIPNWSSAEQGYTYYFLTMNHSSVNYDAYISGSWASDN